MKWHYAIFGDPGRRVFIKIMVNDASLAAVALIKVPADDNFTSVISK